MKRFIKYPSIDQFRSVVKNIISAARFEGLSEDGKPKYNQTKLPKITIVGTEKIHGTNASVNYSNQDGFWVQKRTDIITPDSDNAGCAFSAYQRENEWVPHY